MSYTVLRTIHASRAATGPWAMAGFGGFDGLNPATNVYTVETGDYVGKIAQKMGCSGGAQELIRANPGKNLGTAKIYAGNQIIIPPTCASYVQAQPQPQPQPEPGYPSVPVGPVVNPQVPSYPIPQPQMPQYPSTPGLLNPNPIPEEEWGLFGLGTTATILAGLGVAAVVGTGLYFALKDDGVPPTVTDRGSPGRDSWMPAPHSSSGFSPTMRSPTY